MNFEELKQKAHSLPLLPGVYIMMDKSGTVIYVGKAKALRSRVSSYFRESGHNAKTAAMVAHIDHFDTIVVNSEFEALVTENQLIKHHKPKYNILLKDDKGYPFLRVDLREEYPRFTVVGKGKNDGAKYLGPFSSRSSLYDAVDAVSKALKLPTCSRKFPAEIGKGRPCLNHHMGLCAGYCRGNPDAEAYRATIGEAILIFDGRTAELCRSLEKQMEAAAEELRFEVAAERRDRMRAVAGLSNKQLVQSAANADTDVIGFVRGTAKSCFVVLHFIQGQLLDKDQEVLELPFEEDDGEVLSQLVRQYYAIRGVCPRNIYLPAELEDMEQLEQFLSETYAKRVSVTVPKRGEKQKMVATANINATEECERVTNREERISKTLEWLKNSLGLAEIPRRIEAYDISNTAGADVVGSMTVFENAKPLKRDYRRFKIKTIEGQDDYHSMEEVLTRRFNHYLEGDEKFSTLPDLLLVDGGSVHADMAVNTISRLGIYVPVFGMVKDDRHRTRALTAPDGREIGISGNTAVFSLIGRIQEETHRFAIEYHHKLHTKNSYGSSLEKIPGVGEARRAKLLKTFKSVKAIEAASEAELAAVVPKNTAKAIYEYYHGGENL
ncbi:MAG: excinuclease ABC subunit UvrC [Oscillospiraceae bacterium]|nr:excinuclease ABC subunit UvrC [Oscillospiraceae bacterium]